jgi:hypothetical protein
VRLSSFYELRAEICTWGDSAACAEDSQVPELTVGMVVAALALQHQFQDLMQVMAHQQTTRQEARNLVLHHLNTLNIFQINQSKALNPSWAEPVDFCAAPDPACQNFRLRLQLRPFSLYILEKFQHFLKA